MSTSSKVTRYALVGAGARSFMFSEALLKNYRRTSSLVAICDVNQQRMDFHNQVYVQKYAARAVPTWLARDFDRMIAEAETARGHRHHDRSPPSRLHHSGDGARLRCDHRKADDHGRR